MGGVINLPRRCNVVMVQPCKGGFEITLVRTNGNRTHVGTSADLSAARSVAAKEAFKAGRCRVQLLSEGGRV